MAQERSPEERARQAVEAAWRIEWPKLVAGLTTVVRDIDAAEELAQDALVAALQQWPRDGVPPNPGAWLMLTAKHRAYDRVRRDTTYSTKLAVLGQDLMIGPVEAPLPPGLDPDVAIHDDLLRMVFTACHPVLSPAARTALTLRLVGGLTTDEIARAYLVPEATVAQRIVRAKRTIADHAIDYEVPQGDELRTRLDSVLEVIYLIFNEGYAATSGQEWIRVELMEEGLRLARILAALMPDEPETHGLAALVEMQASRVSARRGPAQQVVLLADQDRARWDHLLIRRGFAALARAHALNRVRAVLPGRYALQAAIAAAHAVAPSPEATDWQRIAGLYAMLAERFPSPIVELNRAVAVAHVYGPAAGLELVDAVVRTGALDQYHLLHAVRGEFLDRLERRDEATAAFRRAAELTANRAEREFLLRRAGATPMSGGAPAPVLRRRAAPPTGGPTS